jgi:hypothetical protein
MEWVKPVQMEPRPSTVSASMQASAQMATQLGKPAEAPPGDWTESFEYQVVARPSVSPAEYLETFKALQSRDCPSATVTPIRVDSAELLLEAKSGGCARYGDQDEIDRLLFGRNGLFHMVYSVKSLDMTADQRKVGINAVNDWNLSK